MEKRLLTHLKQGFIAIGLGLATMIFTLIIDFHWIFLPHGMSYLSNPTFMNLMINVTVLLFIYGLMQFIKHLYWTAPMRIEGYRRRLKQQIIEEEDERNLQIKGRSATLHQKFMTLFYLISFLGTSFWQLNFQVRLWIIIAFGVHYFGSKLTEIFVERKERNHE